MTAEECFAILREVKDVSFATVDKDGRPQVRIIDVMLIEDKKLYFCTARGNHMETFDFMVDHLIDSLYEEVEYEDRSCEKK